MPLWNSKGSNPSVVRVDLSGGRSCVLDVRNAGQLESALVQDGFLSGPISGGAMLFAVSDCLVATGVLRVGPMRRAHPSFEGILLPDQILLCCISHGHEAGVRRHPGSIRSGWNIVMLKG